MGGEYDVRDVSAVDLNAVAATFADIFTRPPWNDDWTAATARTRLREIRDAPGSLGFVIVDGERVCGFALGRLEQWDTGRLYYLQEMGVTPDLQGRGLGSALLERLVEALRDRNVERAYLLTMRESPAASFYAGNGFATDESTRLQYLRLRSDRP